MSLIWLSLILCAICDLAAEMGFKVTKVLKLHSLSNPTQSVLKGCWNVILDDPMVKVDEIGPKPDAKGGWEKIANVQGAKISYWINLFTNSFSNRS